jgi:PAT family beta-lactamase induction signal transducer AmpG
VATGEQVVIQLDRSSGDSNIRVVEGRRFVVTGANAGVPMAAVVQLDAKLDHPTKATLSATSGDSVLAWSVTFGVMAVIFAGFFLYHAWALPHPLSDVPHGNYSGLLGEFFRVFASFFRKPGIASGLAFLVLYRFAEAQLLKIAQLFMLDTQARGGLGLTTSEIGFVYGTVGVIALIAGGILGGFAAARHGLRFWLPWMVLAINVPNLAYVFLAQAQPDNYLVINLAVATEQLGYGFGFAAYMLYMLYLARGEHQTAHYAICTGFMALGMMLPGMWSGWLQELIGYKHFFLWVMIATIPSFAVASIVYWNLDPHFGRREEKP